MEPGRGLCPQSPKSTPFARRLPLMRGMNRYPFIVLAIVFLLLVGGGHTSAHKPVTSKYDYNRDVFPLLREHCGRCHRSEERRVGKECRSRGWRANQSETD